MYLTNFLKQKVPLGCTYLYPTNESNGHTNDEYDADGCNEQKCQSSQRKVASHLVKNPRHSARVRFCCHHFGQRISDLVISSNHNVSCKETLIIISDVPIISVYY